MARQQVQYDGRAEALQTVMAPRVSSTIERYDPNANSAMALAESLNVVSKDYARSQQEREQKAIQEQALKIDAYKEQFLLDNQSGAVSAAQVRERFPETVPIIAARIAESVGANRGKLAAQAVIEEVLKNDDLRLNTAARSQFIADKRKELISQVGPGNDFYLNGLAKTLESEFNQYENIWQRETAEYQQKEQAQAFSNEVATRLTQGLSLEDLDLKWKNSSSLSNIERNALVIKTAKDLAHANNDMDILDRIPTRFLNADAKSEIAQTRINIEAQRMAKYRYEVFEADQKINQMVLERQKEITRKKAEGKPINAGEYADNPTTFKFATEMQNANLIPEYESVANAQRVRTEILNNSTLYSGNDQNSVSSKILSLPGLNPAEKKKLLEEVPTLIEGRIAMNDEAVKSVINLRIDARLKALETSTSGEIASLQGRNLRAEVMKTFDAGIRQSFSTYYETKKQWPTGADKQAIIDRETDRAEKLLEDLSKPGGFKATPKGSQSPAAPAAPATTAAPAAPAAPAKIKSNAEYNALPSGTLFVGPDGVTRRKP